MNNDSKINRNQIYQNRFGLLAFICLSLITMVVLATMQKPGFQPAKTDEVQVQTQLSQSKVVQGEIQTIYLDVDIKTPLKASQVNEQKGSHMIVLLDRSGSMSGSNKMPYAKAAIHDLLSRLNESDHFALVSFANQATLHSGLIPVNTINRKHLSALVNNIHSGGGTNMSDGLNSALSLIGTQPLNAVTKVLLLSDGQANQGITDSNGLSQIVSQLTEQESVLSTIGMGLDFNETLMSALADHGMGHYSYLENLAGLGELFNQDLNATRNIYANTSQLNLQLAPGVILIDAAGYPFAKETEQGIQIKTGQLLNNQNKKFILTFQVNSAESGEFPIAAIQLTYQSQGENLQATIAEKQLTLAVVQPEQRQQAVASIDKDVYQQSWLRNNLGRMRKKVSDYVRSGNKVKADLAINEYRNEMAKAEQQAAMPLETKVLNDELTEMEGKVANAFTGSRYDQKIKQKRASKKMQLGSINDQRQIQNQ